MPLTLSGQHDLDAIENGKRLSEWKRQHVAKWAAKHPEQAARNEKATADYQAAEAANLALGPNHYWLFRLHYMNRNEAEEREYRELWRRVYGPSSAIVNKSAA